MLSEREAYESLQCYTLERGDPEFIHQHVVDAWAAQHATTRTKPITLTFALVGLYLHLEKGFSGRQVQRMHMRMARRKRSWPRVEPPAGHGSMSAKDVMAAPAGRERDRAIDAWCASVWDACRSRREAIVELLREYGIE